MDVEEIIELLRKDKRNIDFTNRGVDPIFQINKSAKILLISQAPGKRVEETGICFNDKSGENLTNWMGIDMDILHSPLISIMPMDFYFPGKGKTGDLGPRKFIADSYHEQLLNIMENIELTVLIGNYAQNYYLKNSREVNLTETVRNFDKYLPEYFPIVHPSPLNNIWLSKNPRFKSDVLPKLKEVVNEILYK